MSLVLQSSGGGSVTIQEPTTASNFTATMPAATGTVMVSGAMPAFSAYLTSNQSLSATTWTKVQCGIEEFDTANCYDSTTNYRFTPNVAGYYQVIGNVQSTSATSITCSIYKNGSEFKRGLNLTTGSATTYVTGAGVFTLMYMNGSTDYIEMYAYVNNTGAALSGGSPLVCYFQSSMVRSA